MIKNINDLNTYLNRINDDKKIRKYRLKDFRVLSYWKQDDIANFLGVSRQTYIFYESERLEIPLKHLLKLSKLYEWPIDLLVNNNEILDKYVNMHIDSIKKDE